MKKIAKNIGISLLVFFATFINFAFADNQPSFDTLSATVIEKGVVFRGDFNSNNNNYFPTNQPMVWFEYGTDPYNLSKQTIEVAKNKGNYIVSHSVHGLTKDRTYYYRAAIRFDSDVDYGETRSFVNIIDVPEPDDSDSSNDEEITTTKTDTSSEENRFLTPQEQYQQYLDITSQTNQSGTSTQSGGTTTGSNTVGSTTNKPFSFWDLFPWWKKDTSTTQKSNLVHSEEEIAAEQKKRDELLATQEKHNNSAAYDDELGDVVKYNTNYKNTYKPTSQASVKYSNSNNGTLNYGLLLFFVILLIVVVLLVHAIIKKRRLQARIDMNHRHRQQQNANGEARYSIPVNRDVHNQKQNPNQAFFRKPPQK